MASHKHYGDISKLQETSKTFDTVL